ncbi:MAG: DMT family transporter [Deltaproteobacteria bacterium]|nr:MAG: DMT family transporter [Deltaproteobacteria bacterium]
MRGRPIVLTWAGVVLISFSGLFVRLAGVEPLRSAFLRCAYALPVFALLLFASRRRAAGALRTALMPLAAVAGGLLGADLVVWHQSIDHIGAGLATVLPNLQVVLVGLVGVLFFGERPRPLFWAALPVVLAGVWMLGATGEGVAPGKSVVAGVIFGLLTAVFYTGYIVLLRVARLRRPGAGAIETMASATAGAAAITFAAAALRGVASPPAALLPNLWLLALALGSQVAGWLLLAASIHRLPAALTGVALLLQPLLALLWGRVLLDEPIGWVQAAGAGVLLTGVGLAHRAATEVDVRPVRRRRTGARPIP